MPSTRTPLETLIQERGHYLGYARVVLDRINVYQNVHDPGMADDVIQEVMIHMHNLEQLPPDKRPVVTHMNIYLRSCVRNACFDVLRGAIRSRTAPGGSMEDLDALSHSVRPEHAWVTQTNTRPDRRASWNANVGESGNQADMLWKYVIDGIDPRTNTAINPGRKAHLLKQDERSRAVLRLALEGHVADDIVRDLAPEGWFTEYDLTDPKQFVQARNTVYQVIHRGFERAKASLEQSGCAEEFKR